MGAIEIKEYRKRHNLTQRQLAEITKCSLRAVQYWESQGRKVPESARELMKIYEKNNHSHNEVLHNTNIQGDNNYINDSNNTTQGIQKAKKKTNEINIYTEMIATQRELIANQNELISQYRKEIEYLRQKVKEYREKYEK